MQYGSVSQDTQPTYMRNTACSPTTLEVLGIGFKCKCCTKIPPCPNFLVLWYHHGSNFRRQSNFQLFSTKNKQGVSIGTYAFQNEISLGYKSDLGLIYLSLFVSHLCAFLCKENRAFNLVSSQLAKCISLGGSDASQTFEKWSFVINTILYNFVSVRKIMILQFISLGGSEASNQLKRIIGQYLFGLFVDTEDKPLFDGLNTALSVIKRAMTCFSLNCALCHAFNNHVQFNQFLPITAFQRISYLGQIQ